jgi:hypothetical protein
MSTNASTECSLIDTVEGAWRNVIEEPWIEVGALVVY